MNFDIEFQWAPKDILDAEEEFLKSIVQVDCKIELIIYEHSLEALQAWQKLSETVVREQRSLTIIFTKKFKQIFFSPSLF